MTRTGYRSVLGERRFAALVLAHTVAMLGTTVASLALAVLIFARTASPLLSSLTFTVAFLPYLLGGVLSPRLEHVPPRRLMVGCDLLTAGLYAGMAVPGLPVPALLGLLAVAGLVAPVFSGTRAALLPVLLGDGEGFVLGRSVLRVISQTGQLLGLAAGGALLLAVSPPAALLGVAAACAASALVLRLGLGEHPVAALGRAAPAGGLRPVLADPRRRDLLLVSWVVPAAAVAAEALAVPYAVDLGLPAASAGLLLWAAPAGAVSGELLTVRLLGPAARERAVHPLICLVLVAPLGFAVRPPLPVAAALMLLSAAGFGYTLGLDQLLLEATPEPLRRRTLSFATAGLMFWQGLGFAVAGAAAEFAPARVVVPGISLAGLVGLVLLQRHTRTAR